MTRQQVDRQQSRLTVGGQTGIGTREVVSRLQSPPASLNHFDAQIRIAQRLHSRDAACSAISCRSAAQLSGVEVHEVGRVERVDRPECDARVPREQ
eukprot:6187086-Pleurochrysis_carterae.AAC.2